MTAITDAVGRAATAVVKQWRGFAESHLAKSPEDFAIEFATTALTAALDVEEMAGALYVSEHPYDTLENWRNHGSEQSKAVYYRLATAVRASILGES